MLVKIKKPSNAYLVISEAVNKMNGTSFTVSDLRGVLPSDVRQNTISTFCRRRAMEGFLRADRVGHRFVYSRISRCNPISSKGSVAEAVFKVLSEYRHTHLDTSTLHELVQRIVPTAKRGSLKSIVCVWRRGKYLQSSKKGYQLFPGVEERPPVICKIKIK